MNHRCLPAFVLPYLDTAEMRRLQHINMNCGMNYTSYPLFSSAAKAYSRYNHSLNTAAIVWHFTQSREQTLAALFHDISTPAFSHVVDFMQGDHMQQEATESRTASMILASSEIMSLLEKDGIGPEAVLDYHAYPVADNDLPGLCADRLEYTLGNLIGYGFETEEYCNAVMEDLVLCENEKGLPEIGFRSFGLAESFALHAVRCGRVYSGDDNRFAMETLAVLLRDASEAGILCMDDLWKDEPYVISRLGNSVFSKRWKAFTELHITYRCSAYEPGAVRTDAKKRYIDPLVRGNGRISQSSEDVRKSIYNFLQEEYSVWLRGE